MSSVTVTHQNEPKTTQFQWSHKTFVIAATTGAFVMLMLYVRCLLAYSQPAYMGVTDAEASKRIFNLFKDQIYDHQLNIALAYIGIGAALGLLAQLTLWTIRVTFNRPRVGVARNALSVLVLVCLFHSWFLGRVLVAFPQLLADQFFSSGGLWRLIQQTLTDWIPVIIFDYVAWIFITGLSMAVIWHSRRAQWFLRAVALMGLLFGMLAGTQLTPSAPIPTQDNILIIAVDSLRPDRVSKLPHLSTLSKQSTEFRNAWTVMARTFPSWVSMLTSKYPHEHGIRHMFPTPNAMATPHQTLLTQLRKKGYRTGVISDFVGDIFSRQELGFEEVQVPRFTLKSTVKLGNYTLHYHLVPYLSGPFTGTRMFPFLKVWERLTDPMPLTDEALRWISNGDGRPFCLVIFYSTPHFPYASPYPYYQRHTADDYDGPSRYLKTSWNEAGKPSDAENKQIVGLYNSAVEATDDAIGKLLNQLDGWGLMTNTHVILTADHGEHLYEGALGIGHGDHLHGAGALRIPMTIKRAGQTKHRTVSNPVRSLDLAPTLLDLVSAPKIPNASGQSLLTLIEGKERIEDPPIFFETGLWFVNPEAEVMNNKVIQFADGFGAYDVDPKTSEIFFSPKFEKDFLVAKHRAILHEGLKLIYIPTRHGVEWSLYDIQKDPEEKVDLIKRRPDDAKRLKTMLFQWMLEDPQMNRQGDFVVPKT